MLRKFKQNIFPHERSQVHAIIVHDRLFLAFEGQMQGPMVEDELFFKGFQTAHALAIERDLEASLGQKGMVQFFDVEIIEQWFCRADHLVVQIEVQILDRDMALKTDAVEFQVTKVDGQHEYLR